MLVSQVQFLSPAPSYRERQWFELIDKIIELKSISGVNAKMEFVREHSDDPWLRSFLYYALNPLISYKLSEKTLRHAMKNGADKVRQTFFKDFFDCCEYLSRLRSIDGATTRQVAALLLEYPEQEREIYIKFLARTLRLGLTEKTVNKVIPNLIPEWEVQQAFPIEQHPIPSGTEFWLTQKLNGVRATLYRGELLARTGLRYTGLDHITSAIGEWADSHGVVLDGELTLSEKDKKDFGLSDNEAFRIATGLLNSDRKEDKTRICFTIFDAIPVTDFKSSSPTVTYSARRALLDEHRHILTTSHTSVLPVLYHGTDQSMIWKLLEQMVSEDKEGLMLNTDVPYYRSRHKGILKVKQFYSMDLPIVRCEEGSGRLSGKLGALVLSFNENEVKVGTGFSDAQRLELWARREDLPGVLCEVKYKEVSSDKKTGKQSLQFPVFVQLREDKFEESHG